MRLLLALILLSSLCTLGAQAQARIPARGSTTPARFSDALSYSFGSFALIAAAAA